MSQKSSVTQQAGTVVRALQRDTNMNRARSTVRSSPSWPQSVCGRTTTHGSCRASDVWSPLAAWLEAKRQMQKLHENQKLARVPHGSDICSRRCCDLKQLSEPEHELRNRTPAARATLTERKKTLQRLLATRCEQDSGCPDREAGMRVQGGAPGFDPGDYPRRLDACLHSSTAHRFGARSTGCNPSPFSRGPR